MSKDEELKIEYTTPGPEKTEEVINEHKKKVTISSDIHYQNVLAFAELADFPKESIDDFNDLQKNRIVSKPKRMSKICSGDYIKTFKSCPICHLRQNHLLRNRT